MHRLRTHSVSNAGMRTLTRHWLRFTISFENKPAYIAENQLSSPIPASSIWSRKRQRPTLPLSVSIRCGRPGGPFTPIAAPKSVTMPASSGSHAPVTNPSALKRTPAYFRPSLASFRNFLQRGFVFRARAAAAVWLRFAIFRPAQHFVRRNQHMLARFGFVFSSAGTCPNGQLSQTSAKSLTCFKLGVRRGA